MRNIDWRCFLRKGAALLLFACMMLTAAVCSAESGPDYYTIGLEITKVIDEMMQSREYLELFLNNTGYLDYVGKIYEARDYDAPAAVYRLEQKDVREYYTSLMPESLQDQLNALSPALQEQVWLRAKGMSTLASVVNARNSSEFIALASILTVQLKEPDLELEEPEYFLFMFDSGLPILVGCGWHSATGMILSLDKAETASIDSLRALLAPYGYEVTPFE